MRITRSQKSIHLTLGAAEGRFLGRVLKQLAATYSQPPDELDPPTANAWYSTRGCATARMSKPEIRDWVRQLHAFKGARRKFLERCLLHLPPHKEPPLRITCTLAEATELLAAFNDHRLWLAARHGMGEEEMSQRSLEQWMRLRPEQVQALSEIHLLAQIIEELLRLLAPDAASWPDATDWIPGEPYPPA